MGVGGTGPAGTLWGGGLADGVKRWQSQDTTSTRNVSFCIIAS